MAVFFINDCKFNGCGKTFPSLSSLIEHIENVHIDFDAKVAAEFEQQRPSALPLSYVLKYSQCRQQKGASIDIRIRLLQHASKSVFEKRNNSFENEIEEEIISESESSNDSWTPAKGVHLNGRKIGLANFIGKDKPYACSVPGCKKRYKNINGIKYHCKNGHRIFELSKKTNNKHIKLKRNKPSNCNAVSQICQDEPPVVQTLGGTAAVNCFTSENSIINLKWNGSEKIKEKVIVNGQPKEVMRKTISPLTFENNESLDAKGPSTYMSINTRWSASDIINRSNVAIISTPHGNNVPNQ